MKNNTKWFTIPLITFSLIFLWSCEENAADKSNQNEEEAVYVEIDTVKSQSFTDFISVVGTIEPINFASISHETGGIIEEIVKDKGDYVNKGDTILILDNDALKASMESAKAQYELAEARYNKQKQVYEENVGSEFEFLNTKFTRNQLKAVYDQAKVMFEKTFVKAPFKGIVDARYFEKGEMVPPATPIVKVLDASRLKVKAGVPERFAGDIRKGAETKIYIKELFNNPIESKVSYVGKALDPANRTFPIEVIITNRNNLIKPEMLAEVNIAKAAYDDVVIIPEEVVTKTDEGYIAFTAENQTAKLKKINIISRFEDQVVVSNGLKDNDQLIVFGFQNLVDGEKIKIVN